MYTSTQTYTCTHTELSKSLWKIVFDEYSLFSVLVQLYFPGFTQWVDPDLSL